MVWTWIPARADTGAAARAMAAWMWRNSGALGLAIARCRVAADPERVLLAGRVVCCPVFGFGVRGKNRPLRSPRCRR